MTSIAIDFRYIDVESELWAIEYMRRETEPTVETLRRQTKERAISELREAGLQDDEAEVDLMFQSVRETTEDVIPRFVRGPFLLALWACFESGIRHCAERRATELKKQSPQLDTGRGAFLGRATRFFVDVLGDPLDVNQHRQARLVDLAHVRNAFAHANAREAAMTSAKWRNLGTVARRQDGLRIDTYRGVLEVLPEYLVSAHGDVRGCLTELVARLKSATQRDSG